MRRSVALLLVVLAGGCAEEEAPPAAPPRPPRGPGTAPPAEPAKVRFDHILIAFEGATKSRSGRSRETARRLAEQLYDALKSGTDWSKVKEEFSDDRSVRGNVPLGPYVLTNFGVPHVVPEIPRAAYSTDLADKLFTMKPGALALVPYHPQRCPFGYHILWRLQ